ncbi:hypothetical protein [Lipingzhangella rawalii]|uniref:hypothetical protein n=1 Tax=Lipingzhangella rawalii TaxID=2055835 RepID=UPI00287B6DA6|nr:hypothetical protein [Lipingzhangella rawalii]
MCDRLHERLARREQFTGFPHHFHLVDTRLRAVAERHQPQSRQYPVSSAARTATATTVHGRVDLRRELDQPEEEHPPGPV